MRFEIRRLHGEFRITTIYVTHGQSEAMVTSDRIAVMNAGRIEQIDDPVSLYNRPRTRFVAGFIGRTNFVDARRAADAVAFAGLAVPAARSTRELAGHSGALPFPVRPSNSAPPGPAPPGGGAPVPGTILQRAHPR